MSTKLEKLAQAVLRMKEEMDDLREQVDAFEKQAQAEEILIKARTAKNVPDGLKTATIEEFVAKRAELSSSSYAHIDKVATLVGYLEETDDLELSDEMDDAEPQDITSWLQTMV